MTQLMGLALGCHYLLVVVRFIVKVVLILKVGTLMLVIN